MPIVKLKKVLSVSSEDEIHCAANLVSPSVGLQWLCSEDSSKEKKSEVTIELAKPSRIKQLEIGNAGSAFVELLVKATSSPQPVEDQYHSLLPQSMLMSAEESRTGRNLARTKLFPPEKLSKVGLEKKWSCIKVVCLQPFCSSRQFGLRFIKLFSHSDTDTPTTPNNGHLSSNLPNKISSPKISPILTPNRTPGSSASGLSPATPSHAPKSEQKLPKNKMAPFLRRRITLSHEHDNDGKDDEFSGVEKQSRLLKNILKHDPMTLKGNPLLSRIADERSVKKDVAKERQAEDVDAGFARKKLLVKDLPKFESVDFLDSYKTKKDTSDRRFGSFKFSNLDDSSEIGEKKERKPKREDHKKGKRRSKKGQSDQWISRGKKPDFTLPSNFKDLPNQEGSGAVEQKSLNEYFPKPSDNDQDQHQMISLTDDNGGEDAINIDSDCDTVEVCPISSPTPLSKATPSLGLCNAGSNDGYVKCPVCNEWLPLYVAELHASECVENTFGDGGGRGQHARGDNDVIWCS